MRPHILAPVRTLLINCTTWAGIGQLTDALLIKDGRVLAIGSDALSKITASVWRSRGYGDFWSHLLVAEGAVDIAIEPELQNYDMAAFIAVVLAAGGSVTGANGQDPLVAGQAITTNGLLHEVVLELIK